MLRHTFCQHPISAFLSERLALFFSQEAKYIPSFIKPTFSLSSIEITNVPAFLENHCSSLFIYKLCVNAFVLLNCACTDCMPAASHALSALLKTNVSTIDVNNIALDYWMKKHNKR
jgi:hypothetical protein